MSLSAVLLLCVNDCPYTPRNEIPCNTLLKPTKAGEVPLGNTNLTLWETNKSFPFFVPCNITEFNLVPTEMYPRCEIPDGLEQATVFKSWEHFSFSPNGCGSSPPPVMLDFGREGSLISMNPKRIPAGVLVVKKKQKIVTFKKRAPKCYGGC